MRVVGLVLMVLMVCGCTSMKKVGVRDGDLAAWVGVPLIELETHSVFSQMKLSKQQLSDGTWMYNYVNSRTVAGDTNCFTTQLGLTTCNGGDSSTITCNNQFFVRDGVVTRYRPLGQCYTSCATWPQSKECH